MGLRRRKRRPWRSKSERRLVDRALRGGQGNERRLLVVPFDRPRDERAAHEAGVGAAARDAPRLLPGRRQPADERRPGFRRVAADARPKALTARRADTSHPMDRIITHLSAQFPLRTADWTAGRPRCSRRCWPAAGRSAGSAPGKGAIVGQVVIAADPAMPDTFTTETRFTFVRTGESVTRKGRAVVYTGFQWRGRGTVAAGEDVWREVLAVDRTRREMSGRWFTGAYDELGIDVRLDQACGRSRRARLERRQPQDRRAAHRRPPLRREPASEADRSRTSASARGSPCRASSRRRPTS